MRSTVALLLLVGAGASQTSAATVSFDPPVVAVSPGETAEFLVSITSTDSPSFLALDVVFLDQGGTLWNPEFDLSFEYSASFIESVTLPPPGPLIYCIYGDCSLYAYAGGFNSNLWTVTEDSPLLIGTLSVDTAGLANGAYDIVVGGSGEQELWGYSLSAITSHGDWEPISGRATVIVPEPAMVSLICVTALCLVRRRHGKRCKNPCQEV